ncbi:hypothetical protein GOA63_16390 [Sinorhizobium meliloti]|uniref:hypothetical protein n=1 Tax=Rhizobium meliloti TaxID=382 RepID=UPI001297C050|nr:hypothetical protein [Sinorhizobium meliloti]MDW9593785.1 hypothetical protein [Sinorhizobium meliloti]MDX0188857.1 hypothetical protein [Sinorhizobium meliloti]MQV10089.1 hypothetical protein [Sinorhizobium meliloti]MQV59229.1 hypothetical protein [Sinorhizobium meliloti]
MTAPLIPDTAAKKADMSLSRSELEHQQRVAKAKAMDAALNDINRGKIPATGAGTRSSSGIESILIVDDNASAGIKAEKAAPVDLHYRVRALKVDLSPDAAQLLSLAVRADEAYRGAQLIDLSALTVKTALGVSENEAIAARSELECHGLIIFHDNGSGHRGFYPRLP